METLSVMDQVLSRIHGQPPGEIYTLKDFLDLGNPETVRKTLVRLEKKGTIIRLLRGVYCRPEHSSILNGPAPVDADAVAQAVARVHGWTIRASGAAALNLLGLTTQVPSVWEYFSDGPTKEYRWEGGKFKFLHRTNRETTILSPKTALVVQALKALGEENVDERIIDQLKTRLTEGDITLMLKEAQFATGWVYEIIKRMAKG
jgi:predicted transcriptional regulator of viral defense system